MDGWEEPSKSARFFANAVLVMRMWNERVPTNPMAAQAEMCMVCVASYKISASRYRGKKYKEGKSVSFNNIFPYYYAQSRDLANQINIVL